MTEHLELAIANGKEKGRMALYFGCWDRPGHHLHNQGGSWVSRNTAEGFPWTVAHLDGGLLKNGQVADVISGRVSWTCGGIDFWYAFYWWDRSVDRRPGSNSGLYVRGFGWPEAEAAFEWGCAQFPKIIQRQALPLRLVERV